MFIFASCIFYTFLAFLLTLGGSKYLTAELPNYQNINTIDTNIVTVAITYLSNIAIILTNPFTAIGFLGWLSIGILVTNIYIIVTSLIP